ncbi:BTB/POZ domain and ankyrin repeat-containing protein NPR1-like [Juglans microcarpa x Juglans regia]|uniref:BTB/POZ domain and ankyrin repeat-containing protein NPR1-like n=1 Tax=Juglans microcarpa x Juglans regia TaxID=2249226 RepID=UPI001B7F40CD|nr:BTB/POZ domain and ankyrin repeat-containing protein NPR1-like [Juglans microcarpa x Juglans regia]
MADDDLRMISLYLESRVGLARLLLPMEAKVAMDIALVDGTSELPLDIKSMNLGDAQRTTVDLTQSPFKIQEEYLARIKALSRSVELEKRFFPRCSEILYKIMDADDISELACLKNDNPEDQLLKKQRYIELQEVMKKAFDQDKEEFDRSAMSSSASISSGVGKA